MERMKHKLTNIGYNYTAYSAMYNQFFFNFTLFILSFGF